MFKIKKATQEKKRREREREKKKTLVWRHETYHGPKSIFYLKTPMSCHEKSRRAIRTEFSQPTLNCFFYGLKPEGCVALPRILLLVNKDAVYSHLLDDDDDLMQNIIEDQLPRRAQPIALTAQQMTGAVDIEAQSIEDDLLGREPGEEEEEVQPSPEAPPLPATVSDNNDDDEEEPVASESDNDSPMCDEEEVNLANIVGENVVPPADDKTPDNPRPPPVATTGSSNIIMPPPDPLPPKQRDRAPPRPPSSVMSSASAPFHAAGVVATTPAPPSERPMTVDRVNRRTTPPSEVCSTSGAVTTAPAPMAAPPRHAATVQPRPAETETASASPSQRQTTGSLQSGAAAPSVVVRRPVTTTRASKRFREEISSDADEFDSTVSQSQESTTPNSTGVFRIENCTVTNDEDPEELERQALLEKLDLLRMKFKKSVASGGRIRIVFWEGAGKPEGKQIYRYRMRNGEYDPPSAFLRISKNRTRRRFA